MNGFWFCFCYEFTAFNNCWHCYKNLLKCCKVFWWFYYANTKDIIFVSFHFIVCMNLFQPLFGLVVYILFGVQILVPFCFYFSTYSSSHSSDVMGRTWSNSSNHDEYSKLLSAKLSKLYFLPNRLLYFLLAVILL